MSVAIVVGVQWGDEGKGKVVDYLTERAHLVVRFQGGSNAGHTLVVEGRKLALRLIPSGILRAGSRCLLASGVVIDPKVLIGELDSLKDFGVDVTPERLGIAAQAQLIMPYHQAVDQERERRLGDAKIGTTGRGIGPAYEDAVSRSGIRLIDLFSDETLRSLLERNIAEKNLYLKAVLHSDIQFNVEEVFATLQQIRQRLEPFVTDVSLEVARAIEKNDLVVFEGAQGTLLDVSHGTYPFVTSSSTVAGYACASAGFGPRAVDIVLGISKAYATRVGSGPFPSEDLGEAGDRLRQRGNEFGTVTGRPRRCGWFDAVAVRHACRLSGIDTLMVTKLDVLSGFATVKIASRYVLDGKEIESLPTGRGELERVKVDYEEHPGWDEDLTGIRSLADLPKNARAFLNRIVEISRCELAGFSVGPGREQTVMTSPRLRVFGQQTSTR